MRTTEHTTLREELQASAPVSDRATERLHPETADIAGELCERAIGLLAQFRQQNQQYKHFSADHLAVRRVAAKQCRRAAAGLLRAAAAILEEV